MVNNSSGLPARLLWLGLIGLLAGCSLQQLATNRLGDVLAAGGSTFAGDDDPELIEAAVPFSLKLMESVLAEAPEHRRLRGAAAAGFTQFAYAFVQQDAERTAARDFDSASAKSARARKLYLRARDHGLRGLEAAHPGIGAGLRTAPGPALATAGSADVDLLYWTAVSWAAAIGLGKDDPDLIADMPIVSALIERALAVDESWNRGAIHAFLMTWEMARPDADERREQRAEDHFARAIELSQGLEAGPWMARAEALCVPRGDLACFENSLREALMVDPAAHPASRLANTIIQRRASWLLANADQWILPPLAETSPAEENAR